MDRVLQEYPFRSTFSLKLLMDFWHRLEASNNGAATTVLKSVQKSIDSAPELLEPLTDVSVLEPHQNLLQTLMSPVFPEAFWESHLLAATMPLAATPVMASPLYRDLLMHPDDSLRAQPVLDNDEFVRARVSNIYFLILQECYGIHEGLAQPTLMVAPDRQTGLDRYWKLKSNLRFVDVLNHSEVQTLTGEDRETILNHLAEPEVLARTLPPEQFEFRGFTITEGVDVTEAEVLSAIDASLVDGDSIFSQTGFIGLQQRVRTLFNKPEITVGLAGIREEQVLILNSGCDMSHSCIFAGSRHVPIDTFEGSFFAEAVNSQRTVTMRDLQELTDRTPIEDEMLRSGVRSILIAPLSFQGQVMGTLDIASPIAGDLTPRDALLAQKIIPRFAMALKRSMDELSNNVQSIIKEKCTAVHPSVEWAFRKAVFDHLESLHQGAPEEIKPIVFRDVFALYGASDIRGSSDARNTAIQADLSRHLDLSDHVLHSAAHAKTLPILDELGHRIEQHRNKLSQGLGTGDDTAIINFLAQEIEPIFPVLRSYGPEVEEAVKQYEASIESHIGTVYGKRRQFESSISLFNERLSAYLDGEEAEAQEIFPHYFNKHQTDGLDYLIYMGASMAEHGGFSDLYVRNLRLWQLIVSCGIAWHVENIRGSLQVPFEATHLILIHSTPLSIRFRFDEKRFDVDGAYDIAHEIVRSRIDKATVYQGRQRLTQPEKIAIVHSRPDEAREMRAHIDFLQHLGFLTDEVESLALDDLPAVQGLKALRVGINLDSPALAERAQGMIGSG